jgi:HJR/Mrr/RecB family endonuclease
MAEYRAYLVDSDGHFFDAVHLICGDDAEAIEKAKQLAVRHDVELWQRDRKIATFNHPTK